MRLAVDKGQSYVIVCICKIWLAAIGEIPEFIEKADFNVLINNTCEELASFIYSHANLSSNAILCKINEAKKLFESESRADPKIPSKSEEKPLVFDYKIEQKPICEFLVLTNRSSLESLEYTHSEETGKIETSFRLSNTITGRFPRLSGSSIAMIETPSKDTKKSYGDYAEFMESPRFSSINASPCKLIATTPVTSPKQSVYSIQEVKSFLLPEKKIIVNESPMEKETHKKIRPHGLRAFSFQDCENKSMATDINFSYEFNRSKTNFEEKKASCQCQSCFIF